MLKGRNEKSYISFMALPKKIRNRKGCDIQKTVKKTADNQYLFFSFKTDLQNFYYDF